MISRTAEACFWMNRYLERVEAMARFVEVNLSFVLDVNLAPQARWMPLVLLVDEAETFRRLHRGKAAASDEERVQEFLTWEQRNPSSLYTSLYWARENARTVRETMSLEMWRTVNELWLWFNGRAARQLYQRNRTAFFRQVVDQCLLYHGYSLHTMLKEEPLDFMLLGTALERVSQTTRMLNVKYHGLRPGRAGVEMPLETAQWLAVLRSCLAAEPFFKRAGDTLGGPAVVAFLLLERALPHAALHNLERAREHLAAIRRGLPLHIGERSAAMLELVHHDVFTLSSDDLAARSLHPVFLRIIKQIEAVGSALYEDFFNPGRTQAPRERARAAG